jgi:hypothetical protein
LTSLSVPVTIFTFKRLSSVRFALVQGRADSTSSIGRLGDTSLDLAEVTFVARLLRDSSASTVETRRADKTVVLLIYLLNSTGATSSRSSIS